MANAKATGINWLFIGAFLTFFLFLGLKLAEVGVVATWSWWWVTSPLWIYFGLILGILVLFVVIAIVALMLGWRPND
jgi:hypothetical protein